MDVHVQSDGNTSSLAPKRIAMDDFVAGLSQISEGIITRDVLYEYMTNYEVYPGDLARFKTWHPERHTRNLVFRNDMLEAMVICWNVGNTTPLHTHNGQLGWMVMAEGQLEVENYRLVECDRPENQQVVGLDCLAGATSIDMQRLGTEHVRPGGPLNTVDKKKTIHRIVNRPEWNEPAVSVHVYSRPIDSCVVFDLEGQRCYRRDLGYDTVPAGFEKYLRKADPS